MSGGLNDSDICHVTTFIDDKFHQDLVFDILTQGQVVFHSGGMKKSYTGNSGVFDFDHEPFFKSAWNKGKAYFDTTVKYHISDHRPLWVEFNI